MINSANDGSQADGPSHFHGVFVEIFGKGVLLTGQSGIGKSEVALALLDRGSYFVTDDIVVFKLSSCGKKIMGSCPSTDLKGFLEVRGLGILDVTHLYGTHMLKDEASLSLICQFVSASTINRAERMESKEKILNLPIPKITIPVLPGRNMPLLVETMVRVLQ